MDIKFIFDVLSIQTQNQLIHLKSATQDKGPIEIEVDMLDQKRYKLVKGKIELTIIQDGYMAYKYDGVIWRTEQIYDSFIYSEILYNMEQIKYLQWKGEYGKSKKKLGKWIASWNGETLFEVGGYRQNIWKQLQYKNGLKQGLWKELSKKYQGNSQAQVYNIGEYINDQKQGKWISIYDSQEIGGGLYNKQGQRDGEWIVLSEDFNSESQAMYRGKYKNGQKVGRWDTLYRGSCEDTFQEIGGGSYDYQNEGYSIKIGRWIDLSDGFQNNSKVIFRGEYKHGQKVGRWDILYKGIDGVKFELIGGGLYHDQSEVSSIKILEWIEVSDRFDDGTQVIYNGKYQVGIKVGRWDIFYRRNKEEIFEFIGGGLYDGLGTGGSNKIGRWIELIDGFTSDKQFTYIGEYQKGKKVGRWDIFQRKDDKLIGGGSYNQNTYGCSIKIGKWIEINNDYRIGSEIIYQGEYHNGRKVGLWDIFFKYLHIKQFTLIGCGSYYDKVEGSSIKNGRWVEFYDKQLFFEEQIIYKGEYKNGIKIGRWDTLFQQQEGEGFEQIGGGCYKEMKLGSIKIGKWIELVEWFSNSSKVIYKGEYKNGIKIGRWDTLFRYKKEESFEQIGGGCYQEMKLGSIKVGKWIELVEQFSNSSKVIYKGEYKNGIKIGKWDTLFRYKKEKSFEQIGGGYYQEMKLGSIKVGKWIELVEWFSNSSTIIYKGEYDNGKKINSWDVLERQDSQKKFELIGKGLYQKAKYDSIKIGQWIEFISSFYLYSNITFKVDYHDGKQIGRQAILYRQQIGGGLYEETKEGSLKIGKWIELNEQCIHEEITYIGEYLHGQKIGRWDIFYRKSDEKKFEQIGGGFYDQNKEGLSQKSGNWVELCNSFKCGTYKQGLKIGRWDILFKQIKGENFEVIGGGYYEEYKQISSVKVGRWVDLSESFSGLSKQITYNGEYKNNHKVGIWMKIDIKKNEKLKEIIYNK